MSKKKVLKGTFYGPAGDKRDIFLVKLGSGGMYLDMDSKLSCGKDNIVMEDINSGSLLGSAVTTPKAKRVNSSIIFGFPLGSSNYKMKKEVELLPPPLGISLEKK
ncbi:hypothetical protein G9A89_006801 [Geosiphon pyriformis]|nr:hypothetical protein G9A89_006801 [Geosiphon pyriformis]